MSWNLCFTMNEFINFIENIEPTLQKKSKKFDSIQKHFKNIKFDI